MPIPEKMKQKRTTTTFKKGEKRASECGKLGKVAQMKRYSIFASIRPYQDEPFDFANSGMTEQTVNSVIAFWTKRNVPKENITAMHVDITPMLADAIQSRDVDTYLKLMAMLGCTFDSTREQNIKVAFENQLKTEVSGELKIEFESKIPEPID